MNFVKNQFFQCEFLDKLRIFAQCVILKMDFCRFQSHGESSLISDPRPPLVNMASEDPYADPANPPLQPDQITGFCAMQWQEDEVQNATGKRMYKLANFESEAEAAEAGWNVTHRGQCGACSILQDLGVYVSRNLTSETRRCGLEGTFLGNRAA